MGLSLVAGRKGVFKPRLRSGTQVCGLRYRYRSGFRNSVVLKVSFADSCWHVTSVGLRRPAFKANPALGGSWVVISGVISPLIWVLITVTLLITPLISPHEPPSRCVQMTSWP